MITIINYGLGNLRSVEKIFLRLNQEIKITSAPNEILKASKLILPGVGHFKHGISSLKNSGLLETLNQKVLVEQIPILGICLGMQLMTKHSEEGDSLGIGWIDARTKRLESNQNLKVPHMGWNSINIKKDNLISYNLNHDSSFYFVHSYYVECNNSNDVLFETNYGNSFVSGFQKNNIYGVQFHPEKSHKAGIQLMQNFVNL